MRKNKIFAMLFSLALAGGVVSCSDDDTLLTLEQPEVVNTKSTYNSLSFSWEAIEDAYQYGYQLLSSEGAAVKAGVTQNTSVKISGLAADTEYTLKVWPYRGMGYATPDAVIVTARTEAIIQIASPVVTINDSDPTRVIVEWTVVENATGYDYTLSLEDEGVVKQGTDLSGTKVTFRNLEEGLYTLKVTATTTIGGYSNSAPAIEEFRIGPDPNDPTGVTIDDLVGTYTNNAWGKSAINDDWTFQSFDVDDYTAVITKVDETTVTLDGLFFLNNPITGTWDAEKLTITFKPQEYNKWYVIAGETETDDIVAKVVGNVKIEVPTFTAWYDGDNYLQAEAILTKNKK